MTHAPARTAPTASSTRLAQRMAGLPSGVGTAGGGSSAELVVTWSSSLMVVRWEGRSMKTTVRGTPAEVPHTADRIVR